MNCNRCKRETPRGFRLGRYCGKPVIKPATMKTPQPVCLKCADILRDAELLTDDLQQMYAAETATTPQQP